MSHTQSVAMARHPAGAIVGDASAVATPDKVTECDLVAERRGLFAGDDLAATSFHGQRQLFLGRATAAGVSLAIFATLGAMVLVTVCSGLGRRPAGAVVPKRLRLVGIARQPESAVTLLESAAMHEVATENVMKVGGEFLGEAQRDIVQAIVSQAFKNMSVALTRHSTAEGAALFHVELNDTEKKAVLKAMQIPRDDRVQHIGLELARVVRANAPKGMPDVREGMTRRLRELEHDIVNLRKELLPKELREDSQGTSWDVLLDSETIRILSTVDEDERSDFGGASRVNVFDELPREAPAPPKLRHPEKLYTTRRLIYDNAGGQLARNVFTRLEFEMEEFETVHAAVALAAQEQGRAFLTIISNMRAGHASKIPPEAPRALLSSALGGVPGDGSKSVSCSSSRRSAGGDSMKSVLFCLLKLGTHGMNALYQQVGPA